MIHTQKCIGPIITWLVINFEIILIRYLLGSVVRMYGILYPLHTHDYLKNNFKTLMLRLMKTVARNQLWVRIEVEEI